MQVAMEALNVNWIVYMGYGIALSWDDELKMIKVKVWSSSIAALLKQDIFNIIKG